MQKLDFVPQVFPEAFKKPGHGANVGTRLPHLGLVVGDGLARFTSRPIGRKSRNGDLCPHMPITLFHELASCCLDLLKCGPIGMTVSIDRCSTLAAKQLV